MRVRVRVRVRVVFEDMERAGQCYGTSKMVFLFGGKSSKYSILRDYRSTLLIVGVVIRVNPNYRVVFESTHVSTRLIKTSLKFVLLRLIYYFES